MLRAAGRDEPVRGVIEVARPEDRLPLPRASELTWRHRAEASAASSKALVDAVRAQLVRERGWPRRSVQVKPFWTPGKRGLE